MSVSLQTLPIKGTYFRSGKHLYYIKDVMPEGTHVLVEDCATNDDSWWDISFYSKALKEVIYADGNGNH